MKFGMSFTQRSIQKWDEIADTIPRANMSQIREMKSNALHLRTKLDKILRIADARLAVPRIGSNDIKKPVNTDWAHRPNPWRHAMAVAGMAKVKSATPLDEDVTLFHDCQTSEMVVRQQRNKRPDDLASYGISIDVFRFDGSFLSLVLEIPEQAMTNLTKQYIIRVDPLIEVERPLGVFARLNIKHGPNTEQIVREVPFSGPDRAAEFDLAYSELNTKRVERMWVDLIFENPEMNQINVRDVTMSRRPRADI